jgi:photosystem II stability/assembly factor-like uncharacterized protein
MIKQYNERKHFAQGLFFCFLLVCFTLTGVKPAASQWTNISTGKITPAARQNGFGSCMAWCAGKLWYAWDYQLWMTNDYGATWTSKNGNLPNSVIIDIDFFDANNGVLINSIGVYTTANGGTTWTQKHTLGSLNYPTSVKFVRNAQQIVATYQNQPVVYTGNGGTNWQTITPAGGNNIYNNVQTRRDGEIHVLVSTPGNAKVTRIARTTNNGGSWTFTSTGLDYDCWTFGLDSCSRDVYTVVNEATYATGDGFAEIFVSKDRGVTWLEQILNTNKFTYTGGMCVAKGGVAFVQRMRGGILRTNDDGANWVPIGGPNTLHETRTICAITKDTIFAADSNGHVWLTTNSGNIPVDYAARAGITMTPDTLFKATNTQLCDSMKRTIRINKACSGANMLGSILQGASAGEYSIVMVTSDSIVIQFNPLQKGKRPAELVVDYDDGKSVRVPIGGTGSDTGYAVSLTPNLLFAGDSVTTCDSITRFFTFKFTGCLIPALSSLSITGTSLADYRYEIRGDSVFITFAPLGPGMRFADFTFAFNDQKFYKVRLFGYGIDVGPRLQITPPSLFVGDSLLTCRSITRGFRVQAGICGSKILLSQGVSGLASGDYTVLRPLPAILNGDDSVIITFNPSAAGARNASYDIMFIDSGRASVPLVGKGIDPGVGLSATRTRLFEKDTLTTCKSITRGFRIKSNACITKNIISQSIVGTANGDYVLKAQAPSPLRGNDTIAITFAPQAGGARPAMYTLILSDSTRLDIPLEGTGIDVGQKFSVAPPSMFDNDSIALCSSISRGARITTNSCLNKLIMNQTITGNAAGDYTLTRRPSDPLSGSDSIEILFTPTTGGLRDAEYRLELPDSTIIIIPLRGKAYYPNYVFDISLSRLFARDTVAICERTEQSFRITSSGCIVPKVISQTITGVSSADYSFTTIAPDSLTGDNIVTIAFAPGAIGARDAVYEIMLADGEKYSVFLQGTGKNGNYTITASPQVLFERDTLFTCEQSEHIADITLVGCSFLRANSQTITGAGAGDYSLITQAGDSLLPSNTIRIRFVPTTFGSRDAVYTMTLSDGNTITIPLRGIGRESRAVSFTSTSALSTIYVGGDVHVPITVTGLGQQEMIELDLTFGGKNLRYDGATSVGGASLDIPGTITATGSRIRIPANELKLDEVTAYANFTVYVDSVEESFATLSGLTIPSQVVPCQYTTSGNSMTVITGPDGCGITIISDFLRYGTKPDLRIYPNPTKGQLTIKSSDQLENVTIQVVDQVGKVCMTTTYPSPTSEYKMNLSSLPSGAYRIRLATQDNLFTAEAAVVVEK